MQTLKSKKLKVEDCIADLLYQYDCVIIPGFGGFVTNPIGSRIVSSKRIIYPGSRKIAFNSRLTDNDGLLINYISRINNEAYTDAQQRVRIFCEKLFEQLESGDKPVIDKLGQFYYDPDNHLQFVADNNSNFSKQSFGLRPVQAVPLENENKKVEQITPKPMSEAREQSGRIYKSKPEYERKNKRKWLVAIPFVLILLMVWVYNNDFEWASSASHFRAKADYSAITDEIISQRLAALEELNKKVRLALGTGNEQNTKIENNSDNQEPISSETETAVTDADKQNQTPSEIPVSNEPVSGSVYFIIAGQFSIEENANKFVETLKSKGFASEIAGKRNQLTLVSCYSSHDKNEIKGKLPEFKEQVDPYVWIYSPSARN